MPGAIIVSADGKRTGRRDIMVMRSAADVFWRLFENTGSVSAYVCYRSFCDGGCADGRADEFNR